MPALSRTWQRPPRSPATRPEPVKLQASATAQPIQDRGFVNKIARMVRFAKFSRVALAAVLIALAAGCSSGGAGGTGLDAALARVSDTAGNRAAIYYDNTAELTSLAGKSVNAEGYGQLRAWGAGELQEYVAQLPGTTGINLYNEDYSITVGVPSSLTLLAGGQDAATVTRQLAKLGFKKTPDGTLTSPGPLPDNTSYPSSMNQVKTSNADLLVGKTGASLSQVGSPAGTTLADDPGIKALAGCLGNVAAAVMLSGASSGITAKPTEIAAGVSQPASATATPHVVVCVSWPTQAAADTYAANAQKMLATGLSYRTGERYSAIFPHAAVTKVGGAAHVVEWQAEESQPETILIFNSADTDDLPALPACGNLPPAALSRIIGC